MRVLEKAGLTAIYTSQYLRTAQTLEPLDNALGVKSTPIVIVREETYPNNVAIKSPMDITDMVYKRTGEKILIVGHSNTIPAESEPRAAM